MPGTKRDITYDKESILQEEITIFNVYVFNNKVSKCMKQTLIELEDQIDEFTIIVRDFNIPLSKIDRSSRQKISKDRVELNSTIN